MTRARRLLAVPGVLLVLAAFAIAVAGAATPPGDPGGGGNPGGPFYLVPSLTHECKNVKDCTGAAGPWVAVPAKGEATYLFGCPAKRAYIVGGTDARATSSNIRVWFDGKLGAPIGFTPGGTKKGAVLLFHAVANNGKAGAFQPIVGCVSLVPKSKRSTVGLPGTSPGAPLDLRAEQVGLRLSRPLGKSTTTLACPKDERLVGSWGSFALATTNPPDPVYAKAVTVTTTIVGDKVHAVYRKDRQFGPLAPLSWAQIGAMCQP
jgi:hypothetical protein